MVIPMSAAGSLKDWLPKLKSLQLKTGKGRKTGKNETRKQVTEGTNHQEDHQKGVTNE